MTYTGTLFGLFNPFALLCGLVSVAMIVMHGAAWLACKTEGAVRERARKAGGAIAALVLVVLFVVGGIWAAQLDGYVLQSFAGVDAPSNPLTKQVGPRGRGADEQLRRGAVTMRRRCWGSPARCSRRCLLAPPPARSWPSSPAGSSIAGGDRHRRRQPVPVPAALVARSDASLTVWDASSSGTTLLVMTVATAIFLPIVLAYTAWVYRVLRGPVTAERVEADHHDY